MDIKHTYIPRWGSRLWLALAATALTGCINEDLSDCGADVALTYDISLQIDLHNELQADLTSAAEQQLAARIEETLGGVFTTQARTVDLSFFDAATLEPYRHDAYTVNAGEATFTLYVQPGSYDHAALANTADLGNLRYTAASRFGTLSVTQEQADTVESQTTGIFTATARLDVNAGQSQHFRVPLHMRNSAAVLVLQPTGTVRPTALTAYVRDMATMFTPADSTFSGFDRSPVVRTVQKYNCAIRQAPLRLCDIYTSLYIQGKTQECVALELGYSEQHIRRLIGELVEYLRKNFIQGGD